MVENQFLLSLNHLKASEWILDKALDQAHGLVKNIAPAKSVPWAPELVSQCQITKLGLSAGDSSDPSIIVLEAATTN